MIVENYDASTMFRHQWRNIVDEMQESVSKPLSYARIRERRQLLVILFTAFINHSISCLHPGFEFVRVDESESEIVLDRINAFNREVTIKDVIANFDITRGSRSVSVYLRR